MTTFHPNEIARRGRAASAMAAGVLMFLAAGFLRGQVLNYQKFALQSETNRLRGLPLPAPRGVILDRNNKVIADNVIGYSISILAIGEDTLRALLNRLTGTIDISPLQVDQALRRFRRAPGRPTVLIPDAAFKVVSVLEEHRAEFPGLIIKLVAGGVALGFQEKAGIDLPEEKKPRFPLNTEYFDSKYGKGKWTNSLVVSMAIGQGDNSQTILNMARFYTALATDGRTARPEVMQGTVERRQVLKLTDDQVREMRQALVGVVTSGTAAASAIRGVQLAGKRGTAQSGTQLNGKELNHAWFVGFAPVAKPSIVVAVMIEFGGHGTRAAAIASRIIQAYLHVAPIVDPTVEG